MALLSLSLLFVSYSDGSQLQASLSTCMQKKVDCKAPGVLQENQVFAFNLLLSSWSMRCESRQAGRSELADEQI